MKSNNIEKLTLMYKSFAFLIPFFLCGFADSYDDILQKDLDERYKNSFKSIIPNEDLEEFPYGITLRVDGYIPSWLQGTYIRTGPGKFKVDGGKCEEGSHLFDGFAFFTSFHLEDNKLTYHSSFAQTDQYKSSIASGEKKLWGVATRNNEYPAPHTSRDGQKVTTTNPAVNIVKIGTQYTGLGETPLPVTLNPTTTETIGYLDYEDKHIKKRKSWESAHPKTDPETGVLYGMHIDYGLTSQYKIYKINPDSTTRHIMKTIGVKRPSYMHDMSITENYIILIAYPLTVNPVTSLKGKYGFFGAHRWEPHKKTKVYVLYKKTGDIVKKLETDAFFSWHHFNAFEDKQGKINIFLRWFNDARAAILDPFDPLNPGESDGLGDLRRKYDMTGHFARLEIDLEKESVTKHILSHDIFELATIPSHLTGKENRYFYALRFNYGKSKAKLQGISVIKYDLKSNTSREWNFPDGVCSEPYFVSSPNATSEDDGAVLTIVYDPHLKKSFLIILDGKSLKEIARAEAPQIIPQGLHGTFVPR